MWAFVGDRAVLEKAFSLLIFPQGLVCVVGGPSWFLRSSNGREASSGSLSPIPPRSMSPERLCRQLVGPLVGTSYLSLEPLAEQPFNYIVILGGGTKCMLEWPCCAVHDVGRSRDVGGKDVQARIGRPDHYGGRTDQRYFHRHGKAPAEHGEDILASLGVPPRTSCGLAESTPSRRSVTWRHSCNPKIAWG